MVDRHDSKAAERLVLEAVDVALGEPFAKADARLREFDALWRHAVADGLWIRNKGIPASVALEVKVSEDVGAPFCQAFDDLGAFDSVLYVRLVNERTRKDIERLAGLHALKDEVMKKVPVRFIEVQF